ncbi:hypothetical protein [Clostridium botulinum]|uniref:hypothetical protein n=1 Tax=Clostridium botulinum TaxID=1491 RepID=UPI00077302C2|nr:hypothetical protein [Clostridium botulinum]NFG11325.1 hypothetical protein [Clostridium botulinum]
MDNYKIKKFIRKFNIDTDNFRIMECANLKKPVSCQYDDGSNDIISSFKKEDCSNCKYKKKCIKTDGEEFNKVIINGKYFEQKDTTNVSIRTRKIEWYSENRDESSSVDELLAREVKLNLGNIQDAIKIKGKKYEAGSISYDGEYIQQKTIKNSELYSNTEQQWFCHGDGKAYYENGKVQYEGQFYFGHPHGNGKYYYDNGILKYDGIFEAIPGFPDNIRESNEMKMFDDWLEIRGRIKKGKAFRKDGTLEYEGEFKFGVFHGNGNLYDENENIIFAGNFENGKPVGINQIKQQKNNEDNYTYIDILNQGVELRRRGEFIAAKEKYLKAIRMEPKKSVGYFNLGKILYILKDYEYSTRSYKVSYELGDFEANEIKSVLWHMGHSLLDEKNKNGRYKKVINDYSKAMKSVENFIPTASLSLSQEYTVECINASKDYLGL